MIKKIYITIGLTLLSATLFAEELQLNPNHPESYTVVKGDTLWGISGRFLTKPWLWPQIWNANPQIKNPDLIYPGDMLTLAYVDGKPVLELSRAGQGGGRNVKLSPTVREYTHEEAIRAIPLDAIHPFLSRHLVLSDQEIQTAPYVVSSQDQHLVNGAGNRIYVRGLPEGGNVTHYTVYRKGDVVYNPKGENDVLEYRAKGDILGYQAIHVGDVVVVRGGDPATAQLITAKREVLNGDRLFPDVEEQLPEFIPHAPAQEVHGNIVSVVDAVWETGRNQVVIINLGKEQGIEPGHVLGIFQSSLSVRDDIKTDLREREDDERRLKFQYSDQSAVDQVFENLFNDVRNTKRSVDKFFGVKFNTVPDQVRLPEERAGELMVFRAFDKLSYALVMNTTRPVHISDSVANP
ncbi:MAG TPA: LysM peptidoglycan-binding domain-containing protein [Gammaproteobacteria bacterium]|nr:LysM peptidoglycan-binding domain-containing protein [Gammaproteobacteria bacterium]